MPSSRKFNLLALGAILLPSLTSATVTLNEFQAITGFPPVCTAAYNFPITGCNDADFQNGAACSQTCINALQKVTTTINSACQGSRADPNSLIGLIFQSKGVATLCPNSAGGSSSDIIQFSTSASTSSTTSTSSSTLSTTSTTSTRSTTSTTSTTSSPSSSTTSTSSRITASSTSSSSSSSSSVTVLTTLSFSSSSTSSTDSSTSSTKTKDSQGFSTTVFNNGFASTITSQAERTGSSNPDAFGGGGSPFEVGPNGSNGIQLHVMKTSTAIAIMMAVLILL